ncbi:hypothetical protein V8C42DRAFT_356381 [Trichoderma barbatum]
MAGELVLLTGGTGFLGFAILLDLLRSGYRVRVAARSQAKIDKVRAAPPISTLDPPDTQLMFVIVPDMAAPGAYDDAVQGVDFIIHAAAPAHIEQENPKEQMEKVFVTASVRGNLGILESAVDNGRTVRRIVVTSSTVAIAPAEVYTTDTKKREVLRGPENRVAIPTPPYRSELEAYCVGKAAALNATETYMRDHTTAFDLISIMPSWIFGKDELVTDTKGLRTGSTLALIGGLLTGNQRVASIGNAVLCADVARAHVMALDPIIEGNQSFLLNVEAKWEDTVRIVKKYFPDAFESGLFQESDPQPTIPLQWDSSKARDVLGIKLAVYDTMIKEVVGQYLELAKGEGK